jgi:hypothetical protein
MACTYDDVLQAGLETLRLLVINMCLDGGCLPSA